MASLAHTLFYPPSNASVHPMREWLRSRLTDSALRQIASNDYGQQVNENFDAFRHQLKTGELLPTSGDTGECCLLQSHPLPPAAPDADHLARLFACWSVMVVAAPVNWTYIANEEYRFLTYFVADALRFGPQACEAAFGSAAWIGKHAPGDAAKTMWHAALLLLQAAVRRNLFDRPLTDECRDFVQRGEQEFLRHSIAYATPDGAGWLRHFMWREDLVDLWKSSARRALDLGGKAIEPNLAKTVSLILRDTWIQ